MTRRRWIADQVSGDRAFLLGSNAEHLARVLRARVGQEFEISTGREVRLGRIVHVADDRVEFELGGMGELSQAHTASIILLAAVFKFDRFEWAIEKATELGVAQILPVIAQRTDSHLASAAAKRVERWRRIAREAAQQSRRVSPPEITEPRPVTTAVTLGADLRIVLAETERGTMLAGILTGEENIGQSRSDAHQVADCTQPRNVRSIALAVGPEGGWTGKEVTAFSEAGWVSARLGATILRSETAAVAAVAIVSALF